MERSGRRWRVNGAQPMLNIRAIHQTPDRSHFYQAYAYAYSYSASNGRNLAGWLRKEKSL
jgi:hypothetical protein